MLDTLWIAHSLWLWQNQNTACITCDGIGNNNRHYNDYVINIRVTFQVLNQRQSTFQLFSKSILSAHYDLPSLIETIKQTHSTRIERTILNRVGKERCFQINFDRCIFEKCREIKFVLIALDLPRGTRFISYNHVVTYSVFHAFDGVVRADRYESTTRSDRGK